MTDRPDEPASDDGLGAVAPFPTPTFASPFPPRDVAPPDPPSDWNTAADAHDLSTAHVNPPREHRLTAPLTALGRFAFPPAAAPDEEGVAARDRRWNSRAIVVAVLVLLLLNGVSIQNWARQQQPGWLSTTVQQLSDVWVAQTAQLGADRPRQAIRDVYEQATNARFPGQKAAPPP